ncbi:MAG: DUF2062 domain-containing protein [Gammaproteobacteria bacterium]|nr:DUF2062 domain-containing protein [Gammaproteobacteria bacterium]MCP5135198.1 DUF2062 domain-containing protein [Gammaproteobacteria bacterium]
MPKKLIQRYMPDPKTIREHKHLQVFGTLLQNPNLWHMNRRSVAGAFAVGMFMAAVPVPFQMLLAAAGAIVFRVNLPISVGLVWVTNPVTMIPMFYFAYLVGAFVMGQAPAISQHELQLSWSWLLSQLEHIGGPFLLGCLILGVGGSMLGYFGIRLLWRLNVARQWRERKAARVARKMQKNRNELDSEKSD